MNKVILLLTAVFGVSVAAFAADPSPSASESASATPKKHHAPAHHHKAKAAPSASASATPYSVFHLENSLNTKTRSHLRVLFFPRSSSSSKVLIRSRT
jgi:hypothetical protein